MSTPKFHHRKLPEFSTLLSGHTPPDDVGFQSERLQIWFNNTDETWHDPQPHAHQESDEIYIILRGGIVIEIEDETLEVKAGEFLAVPRGVFHQVVEVHLPLVNFVVRAPSVNDKVYRTD